MKMSRRVRRFHDPWGNKIGNRGGSPIRFQYEIGDSEYCTPEKPGLNIKRYYVDRITVMENNYLKFVNAGKNSIERLKR